MTPLANNIEDLQETQKNIVSAFWQRAKNNPDKIAIKRKIAGAYKSINWREHSEVVKFVAAGLLQLGLEKGQMVAIMSQTQAEWCWADLAILSCGGITVPVYPTLTGSEVNYILENSDSVGLFIENAHQLQKLLSKDCKSSLPDKIKFVILFEDTFDSKDNGLQIISFADLLKAGQGWLSNNPHSLEERINSLRSSDLCTIVYTSGTTGIPKGAMLTHGNIYSVCQAIDSTAKFKESDLFLSFLPLSHVYERISGEFFAIYAGVPVAYAESMEKVAQNMMEVKPTVINSVPRFYEKAYGRIQSEVRKLPKAQQLLVRWAISLGHRALKHGSTGNTERSFFNAIYRAELRVADRLVFSKIRNRFGGKLRFMVSGAAPLSNEIHTFFDVIGLTVLEGYGLTESAAPAACNRPDDRRLGTVGKALSGVQIKLANDGEILLKGPSVFVGYYQDEEATRQAFKDGWFLTGDVGVLDDEGYLRITDRKKDLIITSNGKHVSPQFIENMYRSDSLISQIVIFGDRQKFISALITLNESDVYAFARSRGIKNRNYQELIKHPFLLKAVDAIVQAHNSDLASFEKIRKYKILDVDLSIQNGELTPTLKVRRKVVAERYRNLIHEFYESEDAILQPATATII